MGGREPKRNRKREQRKREVQRKREARKEPRKYGSLDDIRTAILAEMRTKSYIPIGKTLDKFVQTTLSSAEKAIKNRIKSEKIRAQVGHVEEQALKQKEGYFLETIPWPDLAFSAEVMKGDRKVKLVLILRSNGQKSFIEKP